MEEAHSGRVLFLEDLIEYFSKTNNCWLHRNLALPVIMHSLSNIASGISRPAISEAAGILSDHSVLRSGKKWKDANNIDRNRWAFLPVTSP